MKLKLLSLLLLIPSFLFAQEDSSRLARDSVRMQLEGHQQTTSFDLLPPDKTTPDYPLPPAQRPNRVPDFSLKEINRLPYQTNPSPLFRGDYNTSGILRQFHRGTFFGSGGQTSLPGIGRFNEASLGYHQELNRKLSLQMSINAMQMNMTHFSGQSFSTSGALMYQASDKVAFKVFGSYDIGNSYGMSTNSYGASMTLDMSERFGMEVGVQRYYDAMRGRWETVPMVIPYYRFDKFKLGLDVGGILYEILRGAFFEHDNSGGPTIAPPRPSFRMK